jgi:hypothetical protein
MDAARRNSANAEGKFMAIEPAANEARRQDAQMHARDYSRFVKMFKYAAIVGFITAMAVVLIISN